jgi:hypothetical protein
MIFMPNVESTTRYIDMLYLLQLPDGQCPVLVDELNGCRPFAPQRWIDSGFLGAARVRRLAARPSSALA